MKKVLLALLVIIGIQTQAQNIFGPAVCGSLNLGISISTNPLTDPNLDTAYFTPIIDTNFNVISYVWSFYKLGVTPICPTMLYEKNPTYALLQNTIPIIDTIYVCLEVCLDTLFPSVYCVFCDTFIYDNMGLPFPNWVSINNLPWWLTSIPEIKQNTISNKMYSILGKEFNNYNSIPTGTVYIKNRKKYIKLK